jgi:hypothetical protein
MQQLTSFNGAGSTHSQKAQTLDFSTPEKRSEQLEVLLCQKAQQEEDVSSCIQALEYLTGKEQRSDSLKKIWNETLKERSVFNAVQRVAITSFAILGMIAVLNGVLQPKNQSAAVITPSGIHQK